MGKNPIRVKAGGVEEAIDGQSVNKRSKLGRLRAFDRGISVAQFRHQVVNAGLRTAKAHCGNKSGEPLLPMRMANGIGLELKVQQHAPAIVEQRGQMLRKNLNALLARLCSAQRKPDSLLVARHVFFENRKENVFLIVKMRVKRAAGLARGDGNVLKSRKLKTIARKDASRGIHKVLACCVSPLLLA